jgi:hypothetical protein
VTRDNDYDDNNNNYVGWAASDITTLYKSLSIGPQLISTVDIHMGTHLAIEENFCRFVTRTYL